MICKKFLVLILFTWVSGQVSAQCEYPNSERGEAPLWMCQGPEMDGADFLAIGDKSRMPSVSLQSRLCLLYTSPSPRD